MQGLKSVSVSSGEDDDDVDGGAVVASGTAGEAADDETTTRVGGGRRRCARDDVDDDDGDDDDGEKPWMGVANDATTNRIAARAVDTFVLLIAIETLTGVLFVDDVFMIFSNYGIISLERNKSALYP